jgi:subtilisin family serine protease
MTRSKRRGRLAPRLEDLEPRALLSGEGGLFVGFVPGTPAGTEVALLGRLRPTSVEPVSGDAWYVLPGPGVDRAAATSWLGHVASVRYVEADRTVRVAALAPNDPRFSQQWGMGSAATGGIDAPDAWPATTGSPSTVVAVIDSGIDWGNPDFLGRAWVNAAEAGGIAGYDDDRDGLVDDVYGWNFRDNNNDLSDGADHGTHIAGILAANGNDGYGVAGVDWNARLMILKFIGANGDGAISDAVRAIRYAVDHGARVINASWGGGDNSQALADAISYAAAHNVVFVTAAGNESANNDTTPTYPALDRMPNTLSVAAVDPSGNLAGFSNYGAKTVDVAAPGVGILSDLPNGRFASYSGTSMSTPFVSGVASLLVGLHPEWTAAQVVQRIDATARPLPGLAGRVISGGIVDAARAVAGLGTGGGGASTVGGLSLAPAGGDAFRAQVLASDEYYAVHGGTDESFLSALYQDVLGRPISSGESSYWLGQFPSDPSRLDVARAILGSVEAERTKVARWFQTDLGWAASLEFLKNYDPVVTWANQLLAGVGDDSIHAIILGSDEYRAHNGGTDAGFLAAIYQSQLGRPISPQESALWQSRLAAGTSRVDVALAVLSSTEARRLRVALWYRNDLERPTPLSDLLSDPGVIAWASRITD